MFISRRGLLCACVMIAFFGLGLRGTANAADVKYTYDALGRLSQTVYGPDGSTPPTVEYNYDAAGNRTSVVTSNSGAQALSAQDDAITVRIGDSKTFDPLANDIHDPSYTLTITGKTDGTQGTVAITSGATELTYTPSASSPTTDTFTYTVTDGHTSDTATVNVTINANNPPVANTDTATTAVDTAVNISVLDNDTDADSDTLTITGTTNGSHGTVTTAGSQVTYTPSSGYSGTDSFTYTISDGHGGSATGTVNVTVTANNPPVANTDTATTSMNTAVNIAVLANDTDADSDPLSITGTTNGSHGTVAIAGSQVTYTPDTGYSGSDSFTYTISDGHGGTDTGTVNVTITGVSTSSYSIAGASATEGSSVNFTVSRTGTPIGDETIQYATSSGTAVSGTDFTATSGTLTFHTADTSQQIQVPTNNDTIYNGTRTFTMTLSNASAGSIATAAATGTINDNDTAPSFSINNASATEGSPVVFTVTKSGSTAFSHSVSYATSSGTATSGTDFTAKSGTLTFSSGQTTKTISVSTTNDTTPESNETFHMTLSSATNGATISNSSGTGTIIDNDSPIVLSNTDGTLTSAAGTTYSQNTSCWYNPMFGLTTCDYSLSTASGVVAALTSVSGQTGYYSPTSLSTGYSQVGTGRSIEVDPAHFGTGP